jgi:putative SOS response-associated peptidase YedK
MEGAGGAIFQACAIFLPSANQLRKSRLMTGCNEAIRPVHDRMPVLRMPDEYDRWHKGNVDDAVAFQDRCFPTM